MCGPCCTSKPSVKQICIGGQSIGISGFDQIMERGLAHLSDSDEEQRKALLDEMKNHNYLPAQMEKEYLEAIWLEFKRVRAGRYGWVDDSYHGIPREEIQWFPRIDYSKCSGCKVCIEFCQRSVYTFDERPIVTNPFRCIVTCTGCVDKCKEGAISFPSLTDLREELRGLRNKHQHLRA